MSPSARTGLGSWVNPAASVTGLRCAARGVGEAIRSPKILRAALLLVAVLVVLTLALQVGGVALAWWLIDPARAGSDWLVVGWWALRLLATVAILLASPLVALVLVNVCVPLLAEHLFLAAVGEIDPEREARLRAGPSLTFAASAVHSMRRLGLYLVRVVLVFALGLLPFIGPPAAVLLDVLLTSRALGWELLDPWFSLADVRWEAQRELLAEKRPELLGFAGVPALLLLVPVAGPLAFVLAQAATARFVCDLLDPEGRVDARAPSDAGPAAESPGSDAAEPR